MDVLEDAGTKTLTYLHDFGDGWEHTVKVGHIADAVPGLAYPVLIGATPSCWTPSPTRCTRTVPR